MGRNRHSVRPLVDTCGVVVNTGNALSVFHFWEELVVLPSVTSVHAIVRASKQTMDCRFIVFFLHLTDVILLPRR